MKLEQSDDINIFKKNSDLTTQSRKDIIDLKPKMKKNKNSSNENRMCFVLWSVAL